MSSTGSTSSLCRLSGGCRRRAWACLGVNTLLHLAFKVSVGSGTKLARRCSRSTSRYSDCSKPLRPAASKRVVVAGSALAVGVNKSPRPLDESANWAEHAFDLQYANIRRQAELNALAHASSKFAVMTVCPAFTFGPDDPVGAPANKLVQVVISGKLRFTLPVGFGASMSATSRPVWSCRRARKVGSAISPQRGKRDGERAVQQVAASPASGAAFHASHHALARARAYPRARQLDSRQTGACHARGPPDHRALRLVRHVKGASRTRVVFAAAERDARRHDSVAARPRHSSRAAASTEHGSAV